MKTDIQIIEEMLNARGLEYQTDLGAKLHVNEATLVFDAVGRLTAIYATEPDDY